MYPRLDSKVLYYNDLCYYKVWLGDKYIDCNFDLMVYYILASSENFMSYYTTASTFRKLENNFN